jgi:dGTPase
VIHPATRQEAERREHETLSPLACFSDGFCERPADEEPDPFRTAFVRDRDRILHCGAFRRLKDKTQVFVIDEGDFYRTRLTHTLEVTQMARFLCLALRLNDTLGEALALVHDIGHPPFGHEGEAILERCAGVPFDHNRQALRIVDVLESPYGDRPGLNLTHVVRRSILKHGGHPGRGALPTPGLVLEAQVVDLADSTAYQHHDLEDALRAGILVEDELLELSLWRQAAEEAADEVPASRAPGGRLVGPAQKAVLNRMLKASLHDIVEHSAARLSECDVRDARAVAELPGRLVRFSQARAAQHAELAGFLRERFYRHPHVLRSAETARRAIACIVEHYAQHPEQLPHDYRQRVQSDDLRRSVCDYVAGMTDRFAMDEARRLQPSGVRVPAAPLVEGDDERIRQLERSVHYAFRDPSLAGMALTHASARSEVQLPNERLEFLGDSVLGMCVASYLYERFPDREEGELSRIKSAVVSRHALRRVGESWSLSERLTLGGGILQSGDVPPSVVADAVEAVLGAVYLDGGLEAVRRLVVTAFEPLIEQASDRERSTNFKSLLQNWTQGSSGQLPAYEVIEERGPDHAKQFTMAVLLEGRRLAVASGRNKRQAEQRAAREALALLKSEAERGPDEGDSADRSGHDEAD